MELSELAEILIKPSLLCNGADTNFYVIDSETKRAAVDAVMRLQKLDRLDQPQPAIIPCACALCGEPLINGHVCKKGEGVGLGPSAYQGGGDDEWERARESMIRQFYGSRPGATENTRSLCREQLDAIVKPLYTAKCAELAAEREAHAKTRRGLAISKDERCDRDDRVRELEGQVERLRGSIKGVLESNKNRAIPSCIISQGIERMLTSVFAETAPKELLP